MRCDTCGADIAPAARFCRSCGTQVVGAKAAKASSTSSPTQQHERLPLPLPPSGTPTGAAQPASRTMFLIVTITVIVALFVGGLIFLSAQSDKPRSALPTASTRRTATTTTTTTTVTRPLGQWIAILASVPTGEGRATAEARLRQVRGAVAEARLLPSPSDSYSSLEPGFWVVYAAQFASKESAEAFCRGHALNVPHDCYGRFLSRN